VPTRASPGEQAHRPRPDEPSTRRNQMFMNSDTVVIIKVNTYEIRLIRCIEFRYDTNRLHSVLGYRTMKEAHVDYQTQRQAA
jgi:hypothetical protein